MCLKFTHCTITDKSGFAPDLRFGRPCKAETILIPSPSVKAVFPPTPIWFRFNTRNALDFSQRGGLDLQLKLEVEGF